MSELVAVGWMMELPPKCFQRGYFGLELRCPYCPFREECKKVDKTLDKVC